MRLSRRFGSIPVSIADCILDGGLELTDEEEEEQLPNLPFPQVKFISILPFAPPVPVLEFPKPEEVEQAALQLFQLKNMPDFVQLLKESGG
jgi:hypothetical protein